jgi:5-dehydro-2-deoxygluconokinase
MAPASHPLSELRNSFLVVGRAGLDLYADPPRTRIEQAQAFTAALGGSAANIAVAITRQGGNTSLLTSVSDDAVGRFTRTQLQSYGVDTGYITTVGGEARNSLAVVETRAENCQSVIYRNEAADFHVTTNDVAAVDLGPFTALIVTGTCLAREPSRSATLALMQRARKAGLQLIIDVDYRPYSWNSKAEAQTVCSDAAYLCDIIVGNDEEFAVLSGDHEGVKFAEDLAQPEGRVVVYKMGAKGSITFSDGKRFDTPIFPVIALKPTGAGDGFMGGFLAGLAAGEALSDAVRRGSATAAIVVTRVGCAPAMPTTAEVQAFMQKV